jgi:hypothetical protein
MQQGKPSHQQTFSIVVSHATWRGASSNGKQCNTMNPSTVGRRATDQPLGSGVRVESEHRFCIVERVVCLRGVCIAAKMRPNGCTIK